MKLFFRKFGSNKKSIIILHGLGGMSDNWITPAKALQDNYSVYLLDIRNHGQSPHSQIHTYSSISKDIEEFCVSQSINQAVVMGHSMGGKAAIQFALDFPNRIEKLLVVDIAPQKYPLGGKAGKHIMLLEKMQMFDFEGIRTYTKLTEKFREKFGEKVNMGFLTKNAVKKNGIFSWKLNCNSLIKNKKEISRSIENICNLQKYDFPVIFIKGEKSPYLTPENKLQIKLDLPKAQFLLIINAGHWIHVDNFQEFIAKIKLILAESTPSCGI